MVKQEDISEAINNSIKRLKSNLLKGYFCVFADYLRNGNGKRDKNIDRQPLNKMILYFLYIRI
jgi:hypothetical protein